MKSLTGKVLMLSIDPNATVLALKTLIEAREGIPTSQVRLIQRGRQLIDNDVVMNLTTAEPIHMVFRLSCGDTCAHCSNGCMMMRDRSALMASPRGLPFKRVAKEMRDLPLMASECDAMLALMDFERSGVIVEFAPPAALNSPSRRLFARFVFPPDYPFKAPVDFTLLNEIAHPCTLMADGVSRGSRRRGTVVGSLASTNPHRSPMFGMFKEHWSPALTVSRLLIGFNAILSWPLDETLIGRKGAQSLYNRELVASPFDDLAELSAMRAVPGGGVSPVGLRSIFEALELPLPSLDTAFIDDAPGPLPLPPQTARIRARTLQRAVVLAGLWPELPNLILVELVRACGAELDRALVTDFALDRVIAREKKARSDVIAKRRDIDK